MSYMSVDSFRAGSCLKAVYKEISVSSWFYYREICPDARSHEKKKEVCLYDHAYEGGYIFLIFCS
jgi:hypothetical protein